MKQRYYILLFIFLFFLSQASCGKQPGQPGSAGDTGLILSATLTPHYNGTDTYSVDVHQEVCDPGPPPVLEIFTDHNAVATFTATLERPDLTVLPGTLYIQQYTIDFYRSSDSVGAPPIASDRRFMTIVIPPPAVGSTTPTTVTATLVLVDLTRKLQYYNDMLTGQFTSALNNTDLINNYTAVYTFYGQNDFGDSFSIQATTNFQIGLFDYCATSGG